MLGVRKAFREVAKSVRGMQQENDQLKAENAKLRELTLDMWHLMDGAGVTTGAWGRCVQILDRMRELGVEVTDG